MSDLEQLLGALNTALGVVKTVSETPGINALPYVNTVASAVSAIQAAVAAGASVAPYVQAIGETFSSEGKVPSEAEIAALDAKIDALRAKVNAPLPQKEEDEPE